MKKQAVFIAAIFFSAACFCQNPGGDEEPENKLRIGIKTGLAFADIQYAKNHSSGNHRFKTGGIIGVFAITPITNTLYFQPEVVMAGRNKKRKSIL